MKIAVVGAGWAGLAAAVCAVRSGHSVTVWEASRTLGGRARAVPVTLPDGSQTILDNGQHILIGAYTETLGLMRVVGIDPDRQLSRLGFALRFPDDSGIGFPRWPAPLDALAGVIGARGWSVSDKMALARQALAWRMAGFDCPVELTVTDMCSALPDRVNADLIDPLCISALNTPPDQSSARVFLRVLRDAVFGASGGSNLLLPRVDLSSLFPDAAAAWLTQRGAAVHLGSRVRGLDRDGQWRVQGERFDRVVLATAAPDTLRILDASLPALRGDLQTAIESWSQTTRALQHKAITTVYAWARDASLPRPMLALRSGTDDGQARPAQFVFDRAQLGGPRGLLAFVISASEGDREMLQAQVISQARAQLDMDLQPVLTVVEKRATFACTPGLRRPAMDIATDLRACADYVDGPYPSTIEGAVRTAMTAIRSPGSAS